MQVFGVYNDNTIEEPGVSTQHEEAIYKIAQYAKKNKIIQDLLSFLENEYGFKESVQTNKMMIEDIRQLFIAIAGEERSGRAELIKQQDKAQLGRTKK